MDKYNIEIELKSETILGSGESVPGSVDLEVLYDNYGLPYLKGKTLKGRLREEAENIVRFDNKTFSKKDIYELFGYEDKNELNKIIFFDATVSENIKNAIKEAINNSSIGKEEVFNALTDTRIFTSIGKNGVALDTTLRQIRVIHKGLILNAKINVVCELSEKEEILLALSVASLKHIGLMCNRGKGSVACLLYKNGKEILSESIKKYKGE